MNDFAEAFLTELPKFVAALNQKTQEQNEALRKEAVAQENLKD